MAPKTIISLAVIPQRFAHLPALLRSIRQQSAHIDEIHVNIAKAYKRFQHTTTDKEIGFIKEVCEENKANVFSVEDRGPITKLFPTLKRIGKENTNIVICDDDILFKGGWLKGLIDASYKIKSGGIGYRGSRLKPDFFMDYPNAYKMADPIEFGKVHFIKGVGGCLYRSTELEDLELDMNNCLPSFYSDDVLVGGNLARKGVDRTTISDSGMIHQISTYTHKGGLCNNENRLDTNHIKTIEFFENEFKKEGL